jgi:hypothetical protein
MSENSNKHSSTPPNADSPDRAVSRRDWLRAAGGSAVLFLVGQACDRDGSSRLDAAQGAPAEAAGLQGVAVSSPSSLPTLTMYKDPNCGCCAKWGEHMRDAGFTVNEINSSDMATVKREQGVPERLHSCHTAIVGAYIVEGHVPADLVKKVLAERPALRGLSAPGMPQSAPGMDIGNEKYEIHSFTQQGETALYATRP